MVVVYTLYLLMCMMIDGTRADRQMGQQPGGSNSQAGGRAGRYAKAIRLSSEAAKGQIKLRRKRRIPTLHELVAQITADTRYDEIPDGPQRGKEAVEW